MYTPFANQKDRRGELRMSPYMKELLVAAAEHRRRNLTKAIDVLVESYCLNSGLAPGIASGCSAPYSKKEAK